MPAPTGNTFNNKYQSEYAKQCHKLCLLGAIDDDLADFFEVSRDTIHNWSNKYSDFALARRSGKTFADAEVASKLYQRAVGMTVIRQKVLNNGEIIDYQEQLPPETRAIEYWLQCRQRDKWSPKQKLELAGSAENPLAFILNEVAMDAENASPLPKDNYVV